jgi:citrate synthase
VRLGGLRELRAAPAKQFGRADGKRGGLLWNGSLGLEGWELVTEWIGTAEAARRLGVKQATLYSYVSRGVLRRRTRADGRASLFDAEEVEVLARRGRPRLPGPGELVIESALTEITGNRAFYRGHDIVALAAYYALEDVSWLLWTGELTGRDGGPWRAPAAALRAGRAAQAALPEGTLPLERLQVIVPALAATDPMRLHLDPPAVIAAAQSIMAGMVDCLPGTEPSRGTETNAEAEASAEAELSARTGPSTGAETGARTGAETGAGADDGLTARLWRKLCPGVVAPGLQDVLRAALVLLADHELAASTLAARVAASVRADPYAVVATGMGAVGGALHGGASLGVETMLAAAATPADVPRVVGSLLRRGERIPGFGHFVYRAGDPRAASLLDRIRAAAPRAPGLEVAQAVAAEVAGRGLPSPNIDFALGVLARVSGMVTGAGEAVFAVARTAGWLGHALEEYARRAPLRPRAKYTGPQADQRDGESGRPVAAF